MEIVGLASQAGLPRAVVLSHGVADSKDGKQFVALAELLAEQFDVYVFDYRGFGESGGGSTFGIREIQDLKAVLDLVNSRGYRKVGVVGNSMGGMVSVMEVATYRNAQAVVTAGSPASFGLMTGSRAFLAQRAINHWLGRALYEMGSQVRVAAGFVPIEPVLSADDLSPIPYLIIHTDIPRGGGMSLRGARRRLALKAGARSRLGLHLAMNSAFAARLADRQLTVKQRRILAVDNAGQRSQRISQRPVGGGRPEQHGLKVPH